jgi:hypothetical protein
MTMRAPLLVLALLAACAPGDSPLLSPGDPARPEGVVQGLECHANVAAGALTCGAPGAEGGGSRNLVVGGQNTYVTLAASGFTFNPVTGRYTFRATLRNLIPQAMGTEDGTSASADGIRIFFSETPTATRLAPGATGGAVTVVPDGTGIFLNADQPYFQYSGILLGSDGILEQGETSAEKTWSFDVAPGVETFRFTVYVWTRVPNPGGWLELSPTGWSMEEGETVRLLAITRDAVGGASQDDDPGTWSSSNPSVASVSPGGQVTAHHEGFAVITVQRGTFHAEGDVAVARPGGQRYRGVSSGGGNNCMVTDARTAFCNGSGVFGSLGNGGFIDVQIAPVRVNGGPWDTVTVGSEHACGLSDGAAWCWGLDVWGALGQGALLPECNQSPYGSSSYGCAPSPLPVVGGLAFRTISSGGNGSRTPGPPYARFACATTGQNASYCWGGDVDGELGDGEQYAPRDDPSPGPVAGGIAFREISAGWDHSCGLDLAGHAYCWGDEAAGELGNDGTFVSVATVPQAVQGGLTFRQISAGRANTCGVTTDGRVYCWGVNSSGVLGTVTAPMQDCQPDASWVYPCSPVPVPIDSDLTFQRVAVGLAHACALTVQGEAWCWGDATAVGSATPRAVPGARPCVPGRLHQPCVDTPVRVETSLRFKDIDAHFGTCALSLNGRLFCWPQWGVAPAGRTILVPTQIPEPVS